MNTVRSFVVAVALVLASLLMPGVAPSAEAATSCYWNVTREAYTADWRPSPIRLGSKVCYTQTTSQGWRWSPGLNKYVNPHGPTGAPNWGGRTGTWPRIVATRARLMARDEGVVLQFAHEDLVGRGCFWNGTSSAAYSGDTKGTGIIRMGNSGRPSCNDNLNVILSTVAHELGHAYIEKTCGTMNPPRAAGGGRMEDVTSAVGYLHFADEVAKYGGRIVKGSYTKGDIWRAKSLIAGKCG